VPRSALVLALLLLVAAGALFLVKNQKSVADYTLGGPLFPVDRNDIEGLMATRQGAQFRLDRMPNGNWTLSGAVADYVDSLAIENLLDGLTVAAGGPLLPGTEVEDRRYEFNGPEAIRLTVFLTEGQPISLALGTANPVAGNFYASGAGRDVCFQVTAGLRKTLGDLPTTVQERRLLPGVQRDQVDRVDLSRSGRDFVIDRRDGRWWLKMPAEGPAYLGPEVSNYQAMYSDRRLTDGQGDWVLASSSAMDLLIYEVSDIIVREIKPPGVSADLLQAWDLDPPWRQVALNGPQLNPDPTTGSADRMVIAFGPALDENTVPVLRRGNVLVTDGEALSVLEQPLGILAHRTALTFLALKADEFELRREGRLILRGERTGTAYTPEGRSAWVTVFPAEGTPGPAEKDRLNLSPVMAVNLDRMEILAVLPPTTDPAVLADSQRIAFTVKFGTGENVRIEKFEIGLLVEDRLPAGSPPLVPEAHGPRPVGLWFPDSGKLLQVSDQMVVTARNLENLFRRESTD
jgi:hypothetical protein